jgi:hypothetical protein
VYFEPEGSPYLNRNVCVELESALINLNIDDVCIIGDTNARTGHEIDFVVPLLPEEEGIYDEIDIPQRTSSDSVLNNLGHDLIDFCKASHSIILNGRYGIDRDIGKCTCKDASVVDYALMSACSLDMIKSFEVHKFEEMISDVHCLISLKLQSKRPITKDTISTGKKSKMQKPKWKDEFKHCFQRGLPQNDIDSIMNDITDLEVNADVATTNDIDEITEKINQIFVNRANELNMIRKPQSNKSNRPFANKPWFNRTCQKSKKAYQRARLRVKNIRDRHSLQHKEVTRSEYKKCVKNEFNKFRKNLGKKIRKLKSENPKEYWNIVNNTATKIPTMPSCSSFFDFFKQMNQKPSSPTNDATVNDTPENVELNQAFTIEEINLCLRKLKNNKSCGQDSIINEFLKYSSDRMAVIYTKLFNLILKSGIVPTSWTIGTIKPIFKGKGSIEDPSNYRGITILSCFGKLFTCVLNNRLTSFIENNYLLGKEQAGFRAGFSTSDHLFTLHAIIDIVLSKKKGRLYCAFLDYEKAFDKVNRSLLWQKLLDHNVNGKVLEVIKNMYSNAKSCVMVNKEVSDFFVTDTGVRQGENLSPLLFALFLNDLKNDLDDHMTRLDSLTVMAERLSLDENVLSKMFLLLYADDTVIFSETVEGLQQGLSQVKVYCDQWQLKLNASKCKVIVFSAGKIRNKPVLRIGNEQLDIVYDFPYLGIKFNYDNSFRRAQKDLSNRASRAMFSLLRKCNRLFLPLDVVIELFDKTIMPILTYGCEIWGFRIYEFAQKLQVKFYKMVFHVRQSTPSMFLFGELGKYPAEVNIQCRMLNFWYKLISKDNDHKLSSLMYRFLLKVYKADIHKSKYLTSIKNTLENVGLADVWKNQESFQGSNVWFKNKVQRCIQDKFIQEWYSKIDNSSIYLNYRMFKTSFGYEPYIHILPPNLAIRLFRFRTTNNKLPVNVLRYNNIPRNDRLCALCNTCDIGDEFHYIFLCPFFKVTRNDCLSSYYITRPNALKFEQLMSKKSKKKLLKLCHLIYVILKNIENT